MRTVPQEQPAARLNVPLTLVLSLGFSAIQIIWAVYHAFLPVFYRQYLPSETLVGLFMTIDVLAAATLQPYFGALSDRTNTRHGRRMPFLLIGVPIGAAFMLLLPVAYHIGLLALITVTILMNVGMSIFASPIVSLMPDLTPSPLRGQANGLITLVGGLGGAVAFVSGGLLYKTSIYLPFMLGAALLLVALLIMRHNVREPAAPAATTSGHGGGLLAAFRHVVRDKDRSALLLLLAISSLFCAFKGIEKHFSNYVVEHLKGTATDASITLGIFALSIVLAAVPAGWVERTLKLGRRRTMAAGMLGLTVALGVMGLAASLLQIRLLMVLGGLSYALFIVHAYPAVVEMARPEQTGSYTGLYYFFSDAAALLAPMLFGLVVDRLGWPLLFGTSVVFGLLAFLLLLGVRGGEATPAGPA